MPQPSLKINAISNWVSLFVQLATSFFLTPFIISHIGKSGYGIWTLVGSFIGYYGLLNLGVGSAVIRYIARFTARHDDKSLNETANSALVMFCVTGLLSVIVSFFVAEPLTHFFKIAPEHCREFKHIVWMLGIATGLSFPSGVFAAMITAREKFVAVNIVNIVVTLLRTGLTVIILLAGQGLGGIAYPTLAATIISIVSFILLTRKVMPEFHLRLEFVRFETLKLLLIYGGYTTVIKIADILRMNVNSIIIGNMISVSEVGVYAVAALLIQQMLKLVGSGVAVFSPRFASLDGANKKDELKNIFLRSLTISSFFAWGLALLALLFGQSFILLWVGSHFETAVPVFIILVVSFSIGLSQTTGIELMFAVNKHSYFAFVNMIEAIANLLISITLAPKYGIVGVALGTAIPMVIVKLFVQPVYVSRIAGIGLTCYISSIVWSVLVACLMILVYLLLRYIEIIPKVNTYLDLFGMASIVGIIYILLNCLFSKTIRNICLPAKIFAQKNETIKCDL